ncbi:hypothetical protein Taro_001410 [Colocasia esculenta]|uniref:Uncharacterized protein n=1 Tax=Colocasia esculenta TaxID=4460 RepID=A0A843T9W1_COLES|nr:hypothetical protein [Colocasia esculenta]
MSSIPARRCQLLNAYGGCGTAADQGLRVMRKRRLSAEC